MAAAPSRTSRAANGTFTHSICINGTRANSTSATTTTAYSTMAAPVPVQSSKTVGREWPDDPWHGPLLNEAACRVEKSLRHKLTWATWRSDA